MVTKKCLEILSSGGVIIYPTDTVYGIGCDATNLNSILKVNEIKNRKSDTPLICLMNSMEMVKNYVTNLPDISEKYLYLILGIISILLAFYSFFKPDLGLLSGHKELNFVNEIRFFIFIFLIGILNGSISSGTGLLVTILLIKTFEMDFLRAISMTFFTIGIFWNFIGAVFLARIGSVPPNVLIVLIIGSFTGGYFGAHLSKLNGNFLIKKTFITVCILVGISLLIKSIKSFL